MTIERLPAMEAIRRRAHLYLGDAQRRRTLVVRAVLDTVLAVDCTWTRLEVRWTAEGTVHLADDDVSLPLGDERGGRPSLERLATELFAGCGRRPRGMMELCIINAMSEWLDIEVRHPEGLYRQRFEAGQPQPPYRAPARAPWGTATSFKPDPAFLGEDEPLTPEQLLHELQQRLAAEEQPPDVTFESMSDGLVLTRTTPA
jgi:DNA gyrase subunit B